MTDQEINEAVARKLGYTTKCPPMSHLDTMGKEHCHHQWPDYCHSIEAAWEIVEHVKANRLAVGYSFQCDVFEFIGSAAGWYNSSGNLAWADATTAPMAICLAFLKLQD